MTTLGDRLRENLDPPRTLSFTRTGGYFVLVTLAVGVAAINTGNNLLFLLLGMMLSVIVASGLLSEAVLRRLRVRRAPPRRLFAGRAAPGVFAIENPDWWPALSVAVEEADVVCEEGPDRGERIGGSPVPWWKFWSRESERTSRTVASAYCLRIESGASAELDARYRFDARGVYRLTGLRLVTRFPFSLFEKARELSVDSTVVVYPSPRPAPEWTAKLRGGLGEIETGEAGRGDEYFGLREYRPGEDKRLIHWKRSAARGELVIREHERKTSRGLRFHLCNAVPGPTDAEQTAAFEHGLERLAGLIQEFAERGWSIGLETLDSRVAAGESAETDALLGALSRTRLHEHRRPEDLTPESGRDRADILVAFDAAGRELGGDWDLVLSLDGAVEGAS